MKSKNTIRVQRVFLLLVHERYTTIEQWQIL